MNTITRLVLKWYYRWNRMKEREYTMDDTKIILPPGHPLDWYQRLHPRYDTFLPVLAKTLKPDAVVVDIGANIGDSAIPFLKRDITTVCIEPAEEYLPFLIKNLERNNLLNKALIIDKIVTSQTKATKLIVHDGTATMQSGTTEDINTNTISLDNILSHYAKVDLIKSDTDGWDYDVLLSGIAAINTLKPLLYFENTVSADNLSGYNQLYQSLNDAGYVQLSLFDNLGNLIDSHSSWHTVQDLNHRIMTNKVPGIAYLDILAGTVGHSEIIQQALAHYSAKAR